MQIIAYLNFNGNCEEAFQFYEKALRGNIKGLFRHEGSPMENQVPAEWKSKVMHVALEVGDQWLYGSDAPPNYYQKPAGISVSLNMTDPAEAERLYKAMTNGGKVTMELQETFWAHRFAMFTDKFGIPWMINCSKPM